MAEGTLFLYADVPMFLEQTYKTHSLTLLTYGEDRFQRMKIAGTRIEKFFQGVIVTKDITKVEEVGTIISDELALFVEDNPYALEAVKMKG